MKLYTYKLSVRRSPKDGLYYIRLRGANGETVMASEGHANLKDCHEVMHRIKVGTIR